MSAKFQFLPFNRKRNYSLKFRFACLFLYAVFLTIKTGLYHTRSRYPLENDKALDTETSHDFSFHRHLLMIKVVGSDESANCTPLAMENFPRDAFSQKQRQSGAVLLHICCSVYMFFGLAILCEDYFIPCLERICEILNLQPDVAGATFMAAGSSAPELATTLVGVFIAKDDIGLGAVVGSADFNVMLVISVTALFAKQVIYLNWWPLVRDCTFYLISITLMVLVIYDEVIHWYEALVFLIVYAFYVGFMFFNPRVDAFWRRWCSEHPTCCTRIYRSPEDKQEELHQHSGVFPRVSDNEDSEVEGGGFSSTYTRLQEDQELAGDSRAFSHPSQISTVPDYLDSGGLTKSPVVTQETLPDALCTVDDAADTVILQPGEKESWRSACFAPLSLPVGNNGLRGKLHRFVALSVWPIRLVLCLTIPDVRRDKWRHFPLSHWISFVMCCIWIGLFTVIMMWMITVIGVTFHIPDTIMGLTFIAAGSSVPDAIASVLVVREGEGDMAVSNAIGSNVFDILICMGLPWFLKCLTSGTPVVVYSRGLVYATMTLFATVLFLLGVTHLNRWRLTKPYGFTLLIGYLVVLVFCSLYELNMFGIVHLPECPYMQGLR